MSFPALNDQEERELHRLSTFYRKEAMRCESAKAYLAGSVMLGSALESVLMLMVNCYADEVEATGIVPTRKGKCRPLLDWDLSELIKVAKAAGWLPSALKLDEEWSSRKAKVGDYAEVCRMIRNLAHPGRYLKDHARSRVTAKYLKRQFEIVELCCDRLTQRNNESLHRHMEAEGSL
jgi:hypothetical protein